jgi:hypothetical protein
VECRELYFYGVAVGDTVSNSCHEALPGSTSKVRNQMGTTRGRGPCEVRFPRWPSPRSQMDLWRALKVDRSIRLLWAGSNPTGQTDGQRENGDLRR